MAVSLFLALSRRLQAPVAALLLLAGLQLAVAMSHPGAPTPAARPVTHVRAAFAAGAQIAPDRS